MIASFLLVGEQPYAAAMVQSLKDVHDCDVVQMSDLRTERIAGVDDVVRIPFKIPLMLYRMKHLAAFSHDEMLIVDTDVISKAPIDDLWKQEFDIGLTIREAGELYAGDGVDLAAEMPFNTGVMLSRSQEFWAECYSWLRTQDDDKQRWYGDQLAVAEVASRHHYNLMLLKCSEFNWAPSSRQATSPARFWHYKGAKRKQWIPSSYLSDMTKEKQSPITFSVSPS